MFLIGFAVRESNLIKGDFYEFNGLQGITLDDLMDEITNHYRHQNIVAIKEDRAHNSFLYGAKIYIGILINNDLSSTESAPFVSWDYAQSAYDVILNTFPKEHYKSAFYIENL